MLNFTALNKLREVSCPLFNFAFNLFLDNIMRYTLWIEVEKLMTELMAQETIN